MVVIEGKARNLLTILLTDTRRGFHHATPKNENRPEVSVQNDRGEQIAQAAQEQMLQVLNPSLVS
jgi:hypothetical protein